mmetsp:Transcript_42176/g.119200  ORF Transcript_42176/g.119200 Transcript_42176/m.119200 type:complete len:246 (-) Transcript_42176:396-1133(-)
MALFAGSKSRALYLRSASSPCFQLFRASSQFPCSHSMSPSFLHFSPRFIAPLSVSASAATRSFPLLSSASFSSRSASSTAVRLVSYSAIMASAACSPPASILARMFCSSSLCARSSMNWLKLFFSWLAQSSMSASRFIVYEYLMMGATIRLMSGEQSSSFADISSRLTFICSTLSYWSTQTCRLPFQCAWVLMIVLLAGFRVMWFQNSGWSWPRARFGLCRGSVRSSSICSLCHSRSRNFRSTSG